jgi:pimeloyl-ACP methyl ester carboxylesterase
MIPSIVAVHGLARGFRSWTWGEKGAKGKSWLKNPFPNDVKNARIITYSYNPEALSIEFLVRKILYGRALDLVERLRKLRTKTSTTRRPLIFIAHSLGGLIVKRALIVSNESDDRSIKDIELSTSGIVFFGTPDGSISSESLEEIIRKIAKLSPLQKALERGDNESIRSDTKWFEKEMEAFKPISSKINIISFYESVKTSFARSSFHSSLVISVLALFCVPKLILL